MGVVPRESGNAFEQIAISGGQVQLGDTHFHAAHDHGILPSKFKTSDYELYKDVNPPRTINTCEWVLSHPHFDLWRRNESNSLLWISADPGAGKSVLARALIDERLVFSDPDESGIVLHFFFKDTGRQSRLPNALCALLHQLFCDHAVWHANYALVQELYGLHGDRLFIDVIILWKLLLTSIEATSGQCVCVLDALDECAEGDRPRLMGQLERISATADTKKLRILFTSRHYHDIAYGLGTAVHQFPSIHLAGEEESKSINEEINLVIEQRVTDIGQRMCWPDNMTNDVMGKLKAAENRTYLWMSLVLEEIKRLPGATDPEVHLKLEQLPVSLEHVYETMLSRSPRPADARRLLSLVITAQHPLSLMQLEYLFEGSKSHDSSAEHSIRGATRFKQYLRHTCGLLISVVNGSAYLFHQTIKDFLMASDTPASRRNTGVWKASITMLDAQRIMSESCLGLLLALDSDLDHLTATTSISSRSDTVQPLDARRRQGMAKLPEIFLQKPWLRYPIAYWTVHFQTTGDQSCAQVLQLYKRFCAKVAYYSVIGGIVFHRREKYAEEIENIVRELQATHTDSCVVQVKWNDGENTTLRLSLLHLIPVVAWTLRCEHYDFCDELLDGIEWTGSSARACAQHLIRLMVRGDETKFRGRLKQLMSAVPETAPCCHGSSLNYPLTTKDFTSFLDRLQCGPRNPSELIEDVVNKLSGMDVKVALDAALLSVFRGLDIYSGLLCHMAANLLNPLLGLFLYLINLTEGSELYRSDLCQEGDLEWSHDELGCGFGRDFWNRRVPGCGTIDDHLLTVRLVAIANHNWMLQPKIGRELSVERQYLDGLCRACYAYTFLRCRRKRLCRGRCRIFFDMCHDKTCLGLGYPPYSVMCADWEFWDTSTTYLDGLKSGYYPKSSSAWALIVAILERESVIAMKILDRSPNTLIFEILQCEDQEALRKSILWYTSGSDLADPDKSLYCRRLLPWFLDSMEILILKARLCHTPRNIWGSQALRLVDCCISGAGTGKKELTDLYHDWDIRNKKRAQEDGRFWAFRQPVAVPGGLDIHPRRERPARIWADVYLGQYLKTMGRRDFADVTIADLTNEQTRLWNGPASMVQVLYEKTGLCSFIV